MRAPPQIATNEFLELGVLGAMGLGLLAILGWVVAASVSLHGAPCTNPPSRIGQWDPLITVGACLGSFVLGRVAGLSRERRAEPAASLQLGERAVSRVRLCAGPAVVQAVGPVLGRILPEGLDMGDLVGIELRPQPTGTAEVRNPTLHGHPGPGEGDGGPGRGEQLRGLRDGAGRKRHRSPAKRSSSGSGVSTLDRTRS